MKSDNIIFDKLFTQQMFLIFKIWVIFCIVWSGYIYLFGDIRFAHPFPKSHWIHYIPLIFGLIKIRFIGNLLAGLIIWGLLIPVVLAIIFTKKIYKNISLIKFLFYIFLLQIILYTSSILIDYAVLVILKPEKFFKIFRYWDKNRALEFFVEFDMIYVCIFILGSFLTLFINKTKTGGKNGTT